ncbi:MAG TPA: L-seryl-tRNA(Sec) selenium transferase [Tissierellaceae bacterium]|nr:L-seryl-tRNA(Sec) selenium transferase [Tissierellaceae bacterium]
MEDINLYSFIPKVDEILEDKPIKDLLNRIPRQLVLESIRQELDSLRLKIKEENLSKDALSKELDSLLPRIMVTANNLDEYKLRKVINATGTIIHTNLGRSLLNDKVLEHIYEIANNYSNLEYDIEAGQRGSRYSIVESLICKITGAEAALVVNNNAAAVLLALNTISKDKEVIVSRGELIEIGGSFRIPDVMEASGATLVEVGTTNKTHLSDYKNAIKENTSALLKVHTSNYRILGFTSSVSTIELMELKKEYALPIIEDLGSGVLIDLTKYGLDYEPTVQESLANGVDIVTFSGDKLLGGPQAGIILGKKDYISQMKSNPLTRAIRVDKFTLSALEASLRYYLDEDLAIKEIPTLKMLTMPIGEINNKASELLKLLEEDSSINDILKIEIEDSYSEVGGGSLPLEKLATSCITIYSDKVNIEIIESYLRNYDTPIITRIYKGKVFIDPRTIKRKDFPIIKEAFIDLKKQILSS